MQSAIREHEDPQPLEATLTLRELSAALDALSRIERKTQTVRASEEPVTDDTTEDPIEPFEDETDGKIARVSGHKALG